MPSHAWLASWTTASSIFDSKEVSMKRSGLNPYDFTHWCLDCMGVDESVSPSFWSTNMLSMIKLLSALFGVANPDVYLGSGEMWLIFDISPNLGIGLNSASLAGKLNVLLAEYEFIHVFILFCVRFMANLFWKFSYYRSISFETTSSALSWETICSSTIEASSSPPIFFHSCWTHIFRDYSLCALIHSFCLVSGWGWALGIGY